MYKFKIILIISFLIFFYFLIGILFYSPSSYDYSDIICLADHFFSGVPRMIFSKIYII